MEVKAALYLDPSHGKSFDQSQPFGQHPDPTVDAEIQTVGPGLKLHFVRHIRDAGSQLRISKIALFMSPADFLKQACFRRNALSVRRNL